MNALDPTQTTDFELAGYAHLPAGARPTFTTRYLTARDWLRYRDLLRAAPGQSDEAGIEKLLEAFKLALVGWKNVRDAAGVELPLQIALLPDRLTFEELWEVAYGILHAVQLGEDARKKSASPSDTSSAPAAS